MVVSGFNHAFDRAKKIISFFALPWPAAAIIVAGVLLRLYRLQELFHFTYDESVFAFVGKRIFVNGHIPLIGGVTPFHVHVAPYFYWLSGVFLFFSNLNPVGWGVVTAAVAGATMVVLYRTATLLFNTKVALFAVVLYSFSFYQNIFDRHYWGLVFDGVLALLTIFSLYHIVRGKEKFLYLLSGVIAFGFHADLSTLTLPLLAVITLVYFRPKISKQTLIGAIVLFGASFLPLVAFDVRHNFVNSRGILQYIDEVQSGRVGLQQNSVGDVLLLVPRAMARTIHVFGNTNLARQYSYCSQHAVGRLEDVPTMVSFLIFGLFGWLIVQRKKHTKRGIDLLLLAFISTYLGIGFYGIVFRADLFDHYLATLFPLFFLVVAVPIAALWKRSRLFVIVILLVFVTINLRQLTNAQHAFGYSDKTRAVQWVIAQTGDEPFSLDVIGDCFRFNGYRYLFLAQGKEPAKSYVDANFTHLFDQPPAAEHPRLLAVIANPDFVETPAFYEEYQALEEKLIKRNRFGRIEVLLVDNSDLDFVGKF